MSSYKDYKKYFDLEEIISAIKKYLPVFNEKHFLEAFAFAEKAHKGQLRKDTKTPYITHPVETVRILTALHADEDTLISALLHDVPEDTEHDIHEIRELFGDSVGFLVDGITKLSKVHYQQNMPERQVESLKKLLLHSAEDLRVIVIKLADRLHNMQTLPNIEEDSKRLRIATETLEIYVPIANLLGIREMKSQLEDLCFKYLFPDEYAEFDRRVDEIDKKNKKLVDGFMDCIRKAFRKNNVKAELSLKKKNLYSVFKKMSSLGKTINDVDDRIGIKIVTNDIANCYQILGIVHLNFLPKMNKFRDYIANPKFNGYRSLHTTVFGIEGVLTEVQIRTKEMDIEGEFGIAAYFFDKEKFAKDMRRSSWVKEILEIEKYDNGSSEFLNSLKLDTFQERIFVFTPKGEVIDLPKGASVIDFAFTIHSELGQKAAKADVNGELRPISYILRTGDVVSVISSENVSPELSWLSFSKTNLAKNKILSYFKKVSNEKKIQEGHKILQKEFDIAGLGLCENISLKKINNTLKPALSKSCNSLNDVFVAIAEGEIRAFDVINIFEIEHPSIYAEKSSKGLKINLKILAKNRFGLLRDISEILYRCASDMYFIKAWSIRHDADAYVSAEILVDSLETVSHIFDELEQVDGVTYVYRFSKKRMIVFWLSSGFTSILWIIHPYLLKYLDVTGFAIKHPNIADAIVYGGLFFIIFLVLILANVRKKYFPMVRNKKRLWMVTFLVPLIALITLSAEIFLFNLKLNFLVLFLEISLIYIYLSLTYVNYRKFMRKI